MKKINWPQSTKVTAIVAGLFLIIDISGEIGGLADNTACYKLLGCVTGFFGFDALEHFLGGIALAFIIYWLFQLFPKFSLTNENRWKTIIIIIGVVALWGVFWEAGEYLDDGFVLHVLHEPVLNLKLGINELAQPSNADTVGDSMVGVIGALIGAYFVTAKKK